jgi:hypothetical protein
MRLLSTVIVKKDAMSAARAAMSATVTCDTCIYGCSMVDAAQFHTFCEYVSSSVLFEFCIFYINYFNLLGRVADLGSA